MALLLGLPSLLLFMLSVLRPLMDGAGNPADTLLSALCHRLPSRSISLPWGHSGLCARCTAFWLGLGTGVVAMYRPVLRLPFWIGLPLLVPFLADGLFQLHTSYLSSNPVRVLTGLAAGLGAAVVFLGIHRSGRDVS